MVEQIKKYLISKGLEEISTNCFGNEFIEVSIIPTFDDIGLFISAKNIELYKKPLFSFWCNSFEDFILKFEFLNAEEHECEFCESKQYLKKSTICEICRKKLGE